MYLSFRSDHMLIHLSPSTWNMSTLTIQNCSIRIFILNNMMIKNFTIILPFSNLTTTCSTSLYRISVFSPVDNVNIVNVLLRNMIPTHPIEIIPVAQLIIHFSLTLFTRLNPNTIIIPPARCRYNITNLSVLNSLHQFPV